MIDNFWRKQEIWPADPAGYVFLARAVDRIGRGMFGTEWTGREILAEAVLPLPSEKEPEPRDLWRAHEILKTINPEFVGKAGNAYLEWKARRGRANYRTPAPPPPITPEEWAIAQKYVQEQIDESRPLLIRRSAVQQAIVRECEGGALVSAVRPTRGGPMQVLPRTVWNTERWRERFVWCQMNPEKPFDLGVAGDKYGWIFLTSESLEKMMLAAPFSKMSVEAMPHLSPYMRLMLAVARKLDITPQNQPLKKNVVAELQSMWNGDSPLSETLVEAMGTILREPESGLGKARKQKK